jgi:hypothetical protein
MNFSRQMIRSRGAANGIREPGELREHALGRVWPLFPDADPAAIQVVS